MIGNRLTSGKTTRGTRRGRRRGYQLLWVACLIGVLAVQAKAAEDPALDVRFDTLLRFEYSDARVPEAEDFLGSRTRVGLHYDTGRLFSLFGEIQYALVTGLSENANAASALYRADTSSGMGDTNEAMKLSQVWVEARPLATARLRLGRQPIKMGSLTSYSESDWKYLKQGRLAERLVGITAGTYGVRAYDGVTGLFELGGYDLHIFAAQPTTGVFAIRGGL